MPSTGDIWTGFITKTVSRLRSSALFKLCATFNSREKILGAYYAFMEELKNNRSFAIQQLGTFTSRVNTNLPQSIQRSFCNCITSALSQGKSNGEISERPYLDKIYLNFSGCISVSFVVLARR